MLIHVMRAWLRREQDDDAGGWLVALRDPVVAGAMNCIHERPAEPWTIDALAREVSVSRATLARRFADLVGETPLAYLTRWRMDLAAQRLRDTDDTVGAIAAASATARSTRSHARSRASRDRARALPAPGARAPYLGRGRVVRRRYSARRAASGSCRRKPAAARTPRWSSRERRGTSDGSAGSHAATVRGVVEGAKPVLVGLVHGVAEPGEVVGDAARALRRDRLPGVLARSGARGRRADG